MSKRLSEEIRKIHADLGVRVAGYTDEMAAIGAAEQKERDDARERAEKYRRLRFLAKRGAPEFVLAQLANSWPTVATQALEGIGYGLVVISGIKGTGKTLAALKWLHGAPGPIWYTEAVALNELAPWDGKPWEGKRAIVLDDCGRERDQAIPHIENLVGYAHGLMRCTLVMTTNLSEGEFHARYKERAQRRIKERPALTDGREWVTILSADEVRP